LYHNIVDGGDTSLFTDTLYFASAGIRSLIFFPFSSLFSISMSRLTPSMSSCRSWT